MKNRKSWEGLFCTWNSQQVIIYGTHKFVSLVICQSIIMCAYKGSRISNFNIRMYGYICTYSIHIESWTKFHFSVSHLCALTKEKMFLIFHEILISLRLRYIQCIPTHKHKPSILAKHIISKLYSKDTQLFGLKGNYPPQKHRYEVISAGNYQLFNKYVLCATQCISSYVNS